MKDFNDKVVVITGAASGIGRGIAYKCVQEGMRVVLADTNEKVLTKTEQDLKSRGADVISVLTDVSKIGDVENLAEKTLDNFRAVHLLCNNAGVTTINAKTYVWGSTMAEWKWILGVNLWGVIHGIQVFVPVMIEQDTDCHIVNTASMAGLISPTTGSGIYGVTKHGVVALSESLNSELKRYGAKIRISVLCPGFVSTEIGNCEQNRPAELGREIKRDAEFESIIKSYHQSLAGGMPPKEVAEILFQAIKEERFYVATDHQRFLRRGVKTRLERILNEI